jgi:hypothetical protein
VFYLKVLTFSFCLLLVNTSKLRKTEKAESFSDRFTSVVKWLSCGSNRGPLDRATVSLYMQHVTTTYLDLANFVITSNVGQILKPSLAPKLDPILAVHES